MKKTDCCEFDLTIGKCDAVAQFSPTNIQIIT